MTFDIRSRSVLTHHDLGRFPDDSLFHRVARVVCNAACLPRKELYESWEVARRVRRRFRGGRVVDLACGHALTAALLLVLDNTSEVALAIDRKLPASATPLVEAMTAVWPSLRSRLTLEQADITTARLDASDVIVSTHACGALSDLVLDRAMAVRARVAILPCCHDVDRCDTGGLLGWLEPSLAIDTTRAAKLRHAGYDVYTSRIPGEITPKNRLLLAAPRRV